MPNLGRGTSQVTHRGRQRGQYLLAFSLLGGWLGGGLLLGGGVGVGVLFRGALLLGSKMMIPLSIDRYMYVPNQAHIESLTSI